jgi:hypothetical protein
VELVNLNLRGWVRVSKQLKKEFLKQQKSKIHKTVTIWKSSLKAMRARRHERASHKMPLAPHNTRAIVKTIN